MFDLIFILKYSAVMYSNLTFILSYLISFLEAAKEKDWSRKTIEKIGGPQKQQTKPSE